MKTVQIHIALAKRLYRYLNSFDDTQAHADDVDAFYSAIQKSELNDSANREIGCCSEWEREKIENLRANTTLKQAEAFARVHGKPNFVINNTINVAGELPEGFADELAKKMVEQLNNAKSHSS